jgi:hypothetical protein
MSYPTSPYDTSNLSHAEAFRLYGTLSPRRIEALLDLEYAVQTAATDIVKHVETAHDGLPCEDFAADIEYSLDTLRDDEDISDAASEKVQKIIDALRDLQADMFKRTCAAAAALRAIEDTANEWAQS